MMMAPRVQSQEPADFDAAKELVARDPYRDIRRTMQLAVGASTATLVSLVASAMQAPSAWIGTVIFAGLSAAAWTGVVINASGRRARVREAYAAYLRAETATDALQQIVKIHQSALDASSNPETVVVRMKALIETAEQSGITSAIDNWSAFRAWMYAEVEAKRLAAEVRVTELAAQHGRLLLMRAEDRMRRLALEHPHALCAPTIVVRKEPPRVGPERFAAMVFEGPGQMPEIPGATAEREHSDNRMRIPRVPALMTEKARWAPFAAQSPLTKELLELFGDADEVIAPSDLGNTRASDLHSAYLDGYRSAQGGVVLDSSAAGELMAPARPQWFANIVSNARAVAPSIGIGETTLRPKD